MSHSDDTERCEQGRPGTNNDGTYSEVTKSPSSRDSWMGQDGVGMGHQHVT